MRKSEPSKKLKIEDKPPSPLCRRRRDNERKTTASSTANASVCNPNYSFVTILYSSIIQIQYMYIASVKHNYSDVTILYSSIIQIKIQYMYIYRQCSNYSDVTILYSSIIQTQIQYICILPVRKLFLCNNSIFQYFTVHAVVV